MPRVLSIQRTEVTPGDRATFLARAKARAAHYAGAGCQWWLFEEEAPPGAFLEFTEASDAATLRDAHAHAAEPLVDQIRVYRQVELPQ